MIFTKENARDYIPLFEALADGELQIYHPVKGWTDINETLFSADIKNYRRKPKPVKIYVATWFDKYGENAAWSKSEDHLIKHYSAQTGFKLHELDCGEKP